MRKYGVKDIVFSSTCATYGNPLEVPITETHPKNPINPYGRTKWMIEQILADYSNAYHFRYVALRYFNAAGADSESIIGEWHKPETHLIPLILDTAVDQREYITIFGDDYETKDGTCIRDYIHVTDLANAHIRTVQYIRKEQRSNVFNLGNGSGYYVLEVIQAAERVTGKIIRKKIEARRPGDPAILVGSSKKAQELLGWKLIYKDLTEIISTAWNGHQKMNRGK